MKRGRPPQRIPTIRWDLYIRADLAAAIELILADPMRQKIKYGERSKLIEALLERWLEEQRVKVQGDTLDVPGLEDKS